MAAPATSQSGPKVDVIDAPQGPVDVKLTFIAPPADSSPPFVDDKVPPNINAKEIHRVRVIDICGQEGQYSLDTNAFQTL